MLIILSTGLANAIKPEIIQVQLGPNEYYLIINFQTSPPTIKFHLTEIIFGDETKQERMNKNG